MSIGILLICTLVESLALYALRKSMLIIPILIILVFLLLMLFVLPEFFIPELKEDGVNCGMPILAIHMLFWTYGIISTVCVAVVFFFTKTVK